MSRVTSTKGRKWQAYNRWRSKSLALDCKRRIERMAEKRADFVTGYTEPKSTKPRLPAAWATVIIRFRDGTSARFRIRQSAFGLTISPTLAARKVAAALSAHRSSPAEPPMNQAVPHFAPELAPNVESRGEQPPK